VALDPWDWLPTWDRRRETVLYKVSGSSRTRQRVFAAGQSVEIDLRSGTQYAVTMGAELPVTPIPPPDVHPVEPKPGEHVVLLGDFDAYMPAALKYLRRFAPDLTFTVDKVAVRWPYVTVIAPPEQVSEAVLEAMRGAGALLVERVIAATPTATQTLLDDLAQRGQRFLSTATSPESPTTPTDSATTPSTPTAATYIVQSGDTLSKIARQIYGDANKWNLIFEANRDKLTDPALIRVGMELRLPEK
jgi:nucleoid-associated protein YgaU